MSRRILSLIVLLTSIWLAGCSMAVLPAGGTATPAGVALTQSTPLTGSGFKISYPAGWVARSNGTTTFIEDHANSCDNHDGICVVHDHLSMATLKGMGLADPADLQAMLALNRRFFSWQEDGEPQQTQLFGVPALSVHYFDDGVYGYILMGYVNNEGFILNLSAPTQAKLDEILPTFTAMRASIAAE